MLFGNLMQLYFHDMSEFSPRDIDNQGRYSYQYFDSYWTDDGLYPFLIKVDGASSGFALVRETEDGTMDMAEFFVLRKYRRHGVGAIAARALFDTFPGWWEVRQEPTNFGAQKFWRGVIYEYTNGDFEDLTLDNDHWQGPVQRFDSRRSLQSAGRVAKEA